MKGKLNEKIMSTNLKVENKRKKYKQLFEKKE